MTSHSNPQKTAILALNYRQIRQLGRHTGPLVAMLALAGCGQPAPMILTPPPALLTCKPAPAVPAELPPQGTVERDRATVNLWLAEKEAGADCRSQLSGVRAWVAEVGKH